MRDARAVRINCLDSGESMHCKECLLAVVTLMLVVFGVDAVCGPEMSPWIAYAAPVAMAGRYCGFGFGAAYAVLSGLLILLAAKHSGHPYSSEWYLLLAASSQAFALLLIATLASRLAYVEGKLRDLRGTRSSAAG